MHYYNNSIAVHMLKFEIKKVKAANSLISRLYFYILKYEFKFDFEVNPKKN